MTDTITLTLETVRAAQANDLAAVGEVLAALEPRVKSLADQHARRVGYNVAEYREEFEQEARVKGWEALARFGEAESIAEFFGFVYTVMDGALRDSVMAERNPGIDAKALRIFAHWVRECDGDVYEAEKRAQGPAPEGVTMKRLSADRAYAARLAYTGTLSLDAPAHDQDGATLADLVPAEEWVPEDLMDGRDREVIARHERAERVHHVLDKMGESQSTVLRGTFGIAPMQKFSSARGENADDLLAAEMGVPKAHVQTYRNKGYHAFAKRWVPMVSLGDEDAADWWSAFQSTRQAAK